jgi:hypothetical protein
VPLVISALSMEWPRCVTAAQLKPRRTWALPPETCVH